MRSRLAITSMLAFGLLMTSSGAALGVSALTTTGSASQAQYGTSVPVDNPSSKVLGTTVVTPPPIIDGVPPPTPVDEGPDSAVLGDVAQGGEGPDSAVLGDVAQGGEGGDVAATTAGDAPLAAAQASRQLESGSGGAELPFTGYAAVPTLLIGIGLLAMGLILRRNPGRASAQS
jgi:hypothetical protein